MSIIVVLTIAMSLFCGCAGLRFQSPSVTLAGISVVKASLFEQRFILTLRVQNPNDMDIPVTGMSFEIKLNNQLFAKGVRNIPVTLPRLGEAILEVNAVSNLAGIMRQINELRKGKSNSVSYAIKGRLVIASLPDMNYENSGMIDIPILGKDM